MAGKARWGAVLEAWGRPDFVEAHDNKVMKALLKSRRDARIVKDKTKQLNKSRRRCVELVKTDDMIPSSMLPHQGCEKTPVWFENTSIPSRLALLNNWKAEIKLSNSCDTSYPHFRIANPERKRSNAIRINAIPKPSVLEMSGPVKEPIRIEAFKMTLYQAR